MNPKSRDQIDRISNLPDHVISRILSLMPTKFAVGTSILSKRWRYLWTSITNLDFDHPHKYVNPEPSFIDFIDRVLHLCESSRIQLFRLSCYNSENSGLSVDKWISEAIRLHASEIVIEVTGHSVPMSLFTCKTLTTLKLDSFGSDFPSSVCFPNLKVLSISKVVEDTFERLICGCPMLEDLSFRGYITNQNNFFISITTLTMKRLTFIPSLLDKRTEIVINAPNLECLDIANIVNFRLHKLRFLVEASLGLEYYDSEDENAWIWDWESRAERKSKADRVIQLLREMRGVKSLSLCCDEHITVFEFLHVNKLPVFHYLTRLEMVFVDYNSCKFLPRFLECLPNLQYLSLEKKHTPRFEDYIVRVQFGSGAIDLEIKLKGFKGKKEDLLIVEDLLKYARVLKRLKIICERSTMEKEREFYKLLESWKIARTCKVEFHGRHLQIPSLQEGCSSNAERT